MENPNVDSVVVIPQQIIEVAQHMKRIEKTKTPRKSYASVVCGTHQEENVPKHSLRYTREITSAKCRNHEPANPAD